MEKHRKLGDNHVEKVVQALRAKLQGRPKSLTDETVIKTVDYIMERFPNITAVQSKFETKIPDQHPDLTVILTDNTRVKVNLFKVKGKAKIQPKNLGAKSFLEKYFLSAEVQKHFNAFLEREYVKYLQQLVSPNKMNYISKPDLKRLVKSTYHEFTQEINPIRQVLLYSLREYCYDLLRRKYNSDRSGINNAFEKLLLLDSVNIITRYKYGNKCSLVEEANFKEVLEGTTIKIYKKGQNTLGIRSGTTALLIRFKFESGPSSSIKLATSFEEFSLTKGNTLDINIEDVNEFERLIFEHEQTINNNKSNAIGKCNESIFYYKLLKENLSVYQVDPYEFKNMFKRYSPLVPQKTIKDIIQTADTSVDNLRRYLEGKYCNYELESIQLVPDSYLNDRLDTADLKVTLQVNDRLIQEKFSLKAYSKPVKKLTAKNPGVGTILSEQYFGIGSMSEKVAEVKSRFHSNLLNHHQSLIMVSDEIGKQLALANQHQLKRGIQTLLGESALVISFYSHHKSVILEHGNVTSEITVRRRSPSDTQTTLLWNDKNEELSLRVKFSSGQDKGWSSLKLSCEVRIMFE